MFLVIYFIFCILCIFCAQVRARLEELYREGGVPASREDYDAKVQEALQVRDLLLQNTEEIDSVVKALNGGAAISSKFAPPFVFGPSPLLQKCDS